MSDSEEDITSRELALLRVIAEKVNEMMVIAEDSKEEFGAVDLCRDVLDELWELIGEYNGIYDEDGEDLRH